MHFIPAKRCDEFVASTYRIRLNFELEP
jgi:hypothetical protein